MSARPYIVIAVIGALALAVGYAMVPRGIELAYLHLEAREYREAIEVLEPELSTEAPSAWTVGMAADAYFAMGDIDGAIDVYEHYVRAHPDDMKALRRLDGFLVQAGRTYSRMQTLAEIERRDPSPEQRRDLARLHRSFGQHEAWVADIDALAAQGEATPEERLQAMRYRATTGQAMAELDGLNDLTSLYPDPVAIEAMEMVLAILVEAGEPQRAIERATEWPGMRDAETALRITELFRTSGTPELALRLLRALEHEAPAHPRLLTTLTWLEVQQDETQRAFERLMALYDERRLAPSLHPLLLDVALEHGDHRVALDVAAGLDLGEADGALLGRLMESILSDADPARAGELWAMLEPETLDRRPALAAGLALLLGRRAEAEHWAAVAEQRDDLTPRQQMSLANVMTELGRPQAALAIYRQLVDQHPDAEYGYLKGLSTAIRQGMDVRAELRDFIRGRIQSPDMSSADRRQELLQTVIHLGAGEAVIPILSELADAHGGQYADLHIEALVQTGAKSQLEAALRREVRDATGAGRLVELAGIAFAESLPEVAKPAYERVLELDPDNKVALSRLGHLAYYASDYAAGRAYLDRYFALGGSDYLSSYIYGEIIARGPAFMQARHYFERALEQIESDPAPDLYMQIVKGMALRRAGRPDDAVAHFDRLLAENPDNGDVRSEFVRVLSDLGRYDKAIEVQEAGKRKQ